MNTSDLRKVCGHDSYSVDGCIVCEAAELIDYCLKGNNIEQQLQQAHRQGWEQCQREALFIVQNYEHNSDRDGDFADQLDEEIARMKYKEAEK